MDRLERLYRDRFVEWGAAAEAIREIRTIAIMLESAAASANRPGRGLALAALAIRAEPPILPNLAGQLESIRSAALTGQPVDPELIRTFNETTISLASLPLAAAIDAVTSPNAAAASIEWRRREAERFGVSTNALALLAGVPSDLDGDSIIARITTRERELAILDLIDMGVRAEPLLLLAAGHRDEASEALAGGTLDLLVIPPPTALDGHSDWPTDRGTAEALRRFAQLRRFVQSDPLPIDGASDAWLDRLIDWRVNERTRSSGLPSDPVSPGSREMLTRMLLLSVNSEPIDPALPSSAIRTLLTPAPAAFDSATLLDDAERSDWRGPDRTAPPLDELRHRATLLRNEYQQVVREARESMKP